MLKKVLLITALAVSSLISAQEQSFKVRRYTIDGALFHGMGGADLIISKSTISFTNNLIPEFNNTWDLINLETIYSNSSGWKLQSPQSNSYDGVERNGTRIIYLEDKKKPTLYIDIKDSFTGKVISYSFLLIKE